MRRILLIVLVLILVAALCVYTCYKIWGDGEGEELILYGNVDVRQVEIGFRVAGQVEELLFEEGDFVKAGSLMARLNRTPYISEQKQAEANYESAKFSYENAEQIAKRREALIGIGGVSTEDLDDATTNRSTLYANLVAAEAGVTIAKDTLSYTDAFAPTDGTILSRIREPGTVVNPADPVYTLSVSCPVWVRAFVSEPQLGLVHGGMEAEVTTDTPGAPVYHGKIGFISPIAEFTPKTVQTTSLRTDLVYRLRIYIDNPDSILKQGMPVTVKIKLDRHEQDAG